ncbi:MAG: hypothetical protein IH968_13165 [Gemmatimonadetes bacterium]|nr:hypothetical protein [Gemmatimonadota bacterium]
MKRFKWLGAVLLAVMVAAPVVGQGHGRHAPAGHVVPDLVEIPLRVHGGQLTVQVEIEDGSTLEFIVSTANMVTVFSKKGEARVGDSQLSVAGLPVSTYGSQTVDDSSLTTDDGTVIDGILGSNFLNQFDVLIDAPGGRLVLRKPGREVEWDGVTLSDPVRLRLLHGVILTLDVELNGHAYPAMLDIGTSSVVVNERVKTEASLEDDGVATLKVGNTTHTELPVQVRDLPLFERFSPNGDGFVLVGAPLALDCAVSISYVRQELRTCVR